MCQSGKRSPTGGCKGAEPKKRQGHQYRQKESEMALQPNETLEDTFAGEHRVTANLVGHRKLQQAGGKQQKKKTQAVLGNDVRPPDELAAALRQSHEYHARA